MTKHDRIRLREAIRICIGKLKAQGRFATRELTQMMVEDYGDLVSDASERLIAEALAGIARQLMKNDTPSARSRQMSLPLEIAHLRLPDSMSLPPRNEPMNDGDLGGDAEGVETDTEFLWTDMYEATFEELEDHLQYLAGTIAADVRRHKTLTELHEYLAPVMADDHRTDAIGPTLAEIAKRQREAS